MLDLDDLPAYETTDSEAEQGEEEYEEGTEQAPYDEAGQGMPLHESMRYISDFHDRYRPVSE